MNGGLFPRRRRDSKELFFIFTGSLLSSEIRVNGSAADPQPPRTVFGIGNPNSPHPTDYNRYAISADGQRFLIPQLGAGNAFSAGIADTISSLADGTGLLNSPTATTPISVILN